MDRQALIEQRDALMQELNKINQEIEQLNKEIQMDKVKKVCDLLKELWLGQTTESFEIENFEGYVIEIDFEDLYKSIKRHFDI